MEEFCHAPESNVELLFLLVRPEGAPYLLIPSESLGSSMVEQLTLNQLVPGSSPGRGTSLPEIGIQGRGPGRDPPSPGMEGRTRTSHIETFTQRQFLMAATIRASARCETGGAWRNVPRPPWQFSRAGISR